MNFQEFFNTLVKEESYLKHSLFIQW